MLKAERTDLLASRYAITRDDRTLTTLTLGRRRSGIGFDLEGSGFSIRARSAGRGYDLLSGDGSVLATADGVHGGEWTLQERGQLHRFGRTSRRGPDESLLDAAGHPAGSITRSGVAGAVADLSELDLPTQVFALTVVLLRWRRRRRVRSTVLARG